MKKSVYSITMFDNIVREIDREAYLQGTTRSGIINKILAEYLGMATPENKRRSIFEEIYRLMEGDRDFLINSSMMDSMFAAKTSIRFKYNPTVRYAVAMYPDGGEFFGELRVSLRTQNESLIREMDSFFDMWQQMEDECFGRRLSVTENGKFVRKLRFPNSADAESIGREVARYMRVLNEGISAYFGYLPNTQAAFMHITRLYADYINAGRNPV